MPGSIIQSHPLDDKDGYDKITETQKVTAGYFSDGGTSLTANNIHTGSVADVNEKYYFDIVQTHPLTSSAETQFSIAYGHIDGSGSDATMDNANDIYAPTEAIYKQWTNILLAENEVTGGFIISNSLGETYDKDIYVLVGKRARFKDRINRKNWSLIFSGSNSAAVGAGLNQLYLTDDSATVKAISTVAGPRYNIVSGSQGTVHTAATTKTYGWFYPDQGVMVFSAGALSASIPGTANGTSQVASFTKTADNDLNPNFHSCSGFAANVSNTVNPNNALRFVNCLAVAQNTDMVMRFRSEEDQNSTSYFCRIKGAHANFSTSPTFVSGSHNELRHQTMWGNPSTFITGVQLYDGGGNLVAVGKLSTPLKKNFFSEATIKVKLTY